MNQQDIYRKIGNILSELNEQYAFLEQQPEKLNELEVELFLANADFLSDHVKIIKKLSAISKDETTGVTDSGLLLEAQNIIVLPEPAENYEVKEEVLEPSKLEEIVSAEELEERVDVTPKEELEEQETVHEEVTENILSHDFFKPDQDNHSFEFVLDHPSDEHKFDFEEKSVDEIFDRPLSKAEEEILAQKKKIHAQEAEVPSIENVPVADEDEIGPEPFLIEPEEDLETKQPEPALFVPNLPDPAEPVINTPKEEFRTAPVEDEKSFFTPNPTPVKPASDKPVLSLNELLAKTNSSSQREVEKAPVADLKQAINLNEKLLFIKDLFGGYNMAYSEVIDLVNKMPNFESADSFLQNNYAVKNNWVAKQTTVDQFYELLNRRFRQKE